MLNSLEGLSLPTQGKKSFPFQIQKILLADLGRMIQIATSENTRQFSADQCVVLRDVPCLLHQVDSYLENGKTRVSGNGNGLIQFRLLISGLSEINNPLLSAGEQSVWIHLR